MNDSMNGHDALPSGKVHEVPGSNIAAEKQVIEFLRPQVRSALGVMIRGFLVSAHSGVPPHLLLEAVSIEAGKFIASALVGNTLASTLNIRGKFKAAFDQGVTEANKEAWKPPANDVSAAASAIVKR